MYIETRKQCVLKGHSCQKKSAQKFWSFMELSKQQLEFLKYFIKQYHDHFKKGQIDESHHCAVAVLLELEKLIEDKGDMSR